jgi:hypothetical protein
VALAKMLVIELAKDWIRGKVICPGTIETEIDDNSVERDLEVGGEPGIFPEEKIPPTAGWASPSRL